jgi:hypothetical protein
VLLVEGTYFDHALFLIGDEGLTGAAFAVANDSAGFPGPARRMVVRRRLLPLLEHPLLAVSSVRSELSVGRVAAHQEL